MTDKQSRDGSEWTDPAFGVSNGNFDPDDPIEFPINGELDLHTFRPSDVGELVPDYIEACLERGITRVRIIHGKGIGTLRETVHVILRRHPRVIRFELAGPSEGGWGATIAHLK